MKESWSIIYFSDIYPGYSLLEVGVDLKSEIWNLSLLQLKIFSKSRMILFMFVCIFLTWMNVEEFVAHSANVNCLSIGKKSCRLLITGGDDHNVNLWAIGKPSSLMVSFISLYRTYIFTTPHSQSNQCQFLFFSIGKCFCCNVSSKLLYCV